MAYLQSDLPPSTASARAVVLSSPVLAATRRATRPSARPQRLLWRFVAVLLGVLALVIPGYLAAQATESLAIGILAADLAFLVAVAGWSAVAGGDRNR